MRISIIGPAYPLRGGIAHHVYWLRKELTERGHEVQVLSFKKLYPRIFFPGTTETDTSRLKLDAGALPILTPLNPISWLRAFKRVRGFSADLVIFQWWQPFFGLVTGALARWFKKSGLECVIECHNIFPHESTPLDRPLVTFALSASNHFITHSANDRETLLTIVGEKDVSVAPLPNLEEFSGSGDSSRSGRTILFFGKVRKYKGLDVLLAAMPKVLSEIECKLVVAGEFYDSIDRYRQLIRKHRLEAHVEIDNRYVPNEEVPDIFNRADVLVLPYLSATQSGVASIALSNGLPVIASKTGGLSESVIENVNGLLFPTADSDALADRIISYFTNNLGEVFAENIRTSRVRSGDAIVEMIERMAG